MDPAQRFLHRKQLHKLRKFWVEGEEIESMASGFMAGRGVFIQTNKRQVWAPVKWTKRRVRSQKTKPVQVLVRDQKAAIKVGDWLIQNIDRSRVAQFAAKPTIIQQPKRLFRRAVAKVTKPAPNRADNARKARARVLLDKGQISQKEYEWMIK